MWRAYAALFLLWCAGASSADSPSAAELRFRVLTTNVQIGVDFDLLSSSDFTAAEKEQHEQEVFEPFQPACLKPYTDTLHTLVKFAAERGERSLSALDPLPQLARFLDFGFDNCLAKYDAVGFVFVQLEDGRTMRVPAYLEETIAALNEWGAAPGQKGRLNPPSSSRGTGEGPIHFERVKIAGTSRDGPTIGSR